MKDTLKNSDQEGVEGQKTSNTNDDAWKLAVMHRLGEIGQNEYLERLRKLPKLDIRKLAQNLSH